MYTRNLFRIPHSFLGKQYTGVWGTKRIIKWLFPKLVSLVDECSRIHDEAYDQNDPNADNFINWYLGADATLKADNAWKACALAVVGDDDVLQEEVELFYTVERQWGKMRAWLWKHGVRY